MAKALAKWAQFHRTGLVWGVLAWALLATVASVHALLMDLPTAPLIVTYQEWFAALLLLPWLLTLGASLAGRVQKPGRPDRPALMSTAYVVAAVVFLLDLVLRAVLGLGWEPFFLG